MLWSLIRMVSILIAAFSPMCFFQYNKQRTHKPKYFLNVSTQSKNVIEIEEPQPFYLKIALDI